MKFSYFWSSAGLLFLFLSPFSPLPVWAQAPAPSGVTILSPYNGQVNLEWTPDTLGSGVTAYAISRQLLNLTCTPTPTPTGPFTPDATPTPIATVLLSAMPEAGTPVFQDFQVTNGRVYLYQVQGIDLNGPGISSAVTAAPFLAPAAVQPVSVLNIHSNALDLFWGVPVSSYPISYYSVYRYAYMATTLLPTSTSTNSPTITPTATSTPIGTWNTSTATFTPTPFTPTSTATAVFSPIAPISVATIFVPINLIAASVTGTSYSDTTCSPGPEAYYYVVMAADSDNPGNLSAQPSVPSNPALPQNMSPPGPVSLTGVLSTTTYGVSLSWTGSLSTENVTAYQVLQNSSITLTTIPYAGSGSVSYFDNTIPGTGQPVVYTVQATNAFGTTNSNPISITVAECSEASIIVTPDATTNAVTVTWQPATSGTYGLGGYQVYKSLYGVPANNPTPIASATATPNPFYVVTFNPTVGYTITPVIDTPIQNHMNYWVQPLDSTGHGGLVGVAVPPALNLAPTPPTNVGAAAPVGNDQIAVSWQAGTPGFFDSAQRYVIFRLNFTTPTPTPRFVAKVPATQLSYTDIAPELTPGTLLGYQVALADALGNTSDPASSNPVTTILLSNPPATPRVLPFTGSDTSILFSWAANPRADSVTNYLVYGSDWLTVSGNTPTPVLVAPATGTPTRVFTFAPTPTPWTANNYYLVAQNAVGNSQPATMNGIPVPAYNVTAVIPAGTQQVSVSWNLVPALTVTPVIDSYGIYRSLTPDANFTPVTTVPISTTGYMDVPPTATAGVSYYYRVTARSGQSAESPLYSVLTPDPQGSVLIWPNAPSGLTSISGANQTTLYWAGNASQENVLSYVIYQNGTPTMTVTPSPTLSVGFVETPGNLSVYQVVANNSAGPSTLSQAVSVLVPPAVTPSIGLTPPPYVTPVPSQTPAFYPAVWITGLTYSNAVGGYSINRLSVPTPSTTPTYVAIGSVNSPVSYYSDTGFAPGYVNSYQVVANNGLGLNSNPAVSAQWGVTLWPNPTNFSFAGNATSVTVSWATPTGNNVNVTGYDIYRSLYPTMTPNPTPLVSSTPPINNYFDSAVTTGTAYIYWMDAQNASGNSGLSAPQSFIPAPVPTLYLTPLAESNQLFWMPITVAATSPVTGYAIYRAGVTPSQTPNFAPIGSIVEPISNTNYVDTSNLTDGVSYIYEIAPSSQNNILGPFSNIVGQNTYPKPVSNLVAVSSDSLVQLRWNSEGVTNSTVIIQRKLGPASAASFQTIANRYQGANFIDTGVQDKNYYVYHVYTVDAQGMTSNAYASAIALPAAAPILPIVQTAESGGSTILVTGSPVTLTQNTSDTQTLIGNTLSWGGADQTFNPQTMYPLGGYSISRSMDGGGVYQNIGTIPATFVNGLPTASASYFDPVTLINGIPYTYLVQAFDNPPDLPVPLSEAVTEDLVHLSGYNPVTGYPISPNTALDRNAIRPFGASNEQLVKIRFVVTTPGNVTIKVYTLDGTFIEPLVNQVYYQPGIYWTSWDAHNKNGNLVASGVYLITTESPGGHQEFSKVAVIK